MKIYFCLFKRLSIIIYTQIVISILSPCNAQILSGKILDSNDSPKSNFKIFIYDLNNIPIDSAITNKEGIFKFEKVENLKKRIYIVAYPNYINDKNSKDLKIIGKKNKIVKLERKESFKAKIDLKDYDLDSKEILELTEKLKNYKDSLDNFKVKYNQQLNTQLKTQLNLSNKIAKDSILLINDVEGLDVIDFKISTKYLSNLSERCKILNLQNLEPKLNDFKNKVNALEFADKILNKELKNLTEIDDAIDYIKSTFQNSKFKFNALENSKNEHIDLLENYKKKIEILCDNFNYILELKTYNKDKKQSQIRQLFFTKDFEGYGYLNKLISIFYDNPSQEIFDRNIKIYCIK
jgi:hypothetical protein